MQYRCVTDIDTCTEMVVMDFVWFQSQGQHKPGVVIPMGPQPVQPSPQSMQNIQIKPVGKSPSTIQIRQEGG